LNTTRMIKNGLCWVFDFCLATVGINSHYTFAEINGSIQANALVKNSFYLFRCIVRRVSMAEWSEADEQA
ncbi:hypothetical protein, partial [Endozoicomonas sp. SESOKO4]|uniref:hypothetical protein n=1 Tax=Endozoicomonas sp. SESOKO4 TaxID=2828745 RepID=UPI002149982A